MATKINLADQLMARPAPKSVRWSSDAAASGAGGFASVLESAGKANAGLSQVEQAPKAESKAAKPSKAPEKEAKDSAAKKDAASDDSAQAQGQVQVPAQGSEPTTQTEDSGATSEAKASDSSDKKAAQGSSDGAADGSAVKVEGTQDAGVPAADGATGGKAAAEKKSLLKEVVVLPEGAAKGQGAKDGAGTLKAAADAKSAEAGAKQADAADPQGEKSAGDGAGEGAAGKRAAKAERAGAKGTVPQGEEEQGANAASNSAIKGVEAMAGMVASATEGTAEAAAVMPRAAPMKEEPPVAAGSPTLAAGSEQGNAGGAAASAGSAGAAQDSPRTGADSPYEQIVLGLRTKLDANNQRAQIELNPPNLGRLQVSVEVSNGQLTAQFHATTDVVRDLLRSNMDRLRSVLEGQGITVDKLAVSSGSSPGAVASTNESGLANQSHDGRSGGAFAQDRQAPRQQGGETFGKVWRDVRGQEEPIDLLA